jgi:hypothetical protein
MHLPLILRLYCAVFLFRLLTLREAERTIVLRLELRLSAKVRNCPHLLIVFLLSFEVKVIHIMHCRLQETDRSPELYLMDWSAERVVKFCCMSNFKPRWLTERIMLFKLVITSAIVLARLEFAYVWYTTPVFFWSSTEDKQY